METHVKEFSTPKPNKNDDNHVSTLILKGASKKTIKSLTGLHFGYINRYLRERSTDEERTKILEAGR